MRRFNKRTTLVFGVASAISMLLLTGCASSTPAPDSMAMKQTELSFNINKCEMLGAGLYKCPAIDKPICNPDYTGTPVECLHTDKNGNITIQQLQTQ